MHNSKPFFDRPMFFDTECLICGGTGKIPRWGVGVRFRNKAFRWRNRPTCQMCLGFKKLKYVITRENDLMLEWSWGFTTDGWAWIATYNYNGHAMTWQQLDEQQCGEFIDEDEELDCSTGRPPGPANDP